MNDQMPIRDPSPTPDETERVFTRDDSTPPQSARPTTIRELKKFGQVSRLKEPTPGPYKYRGRVMQDRPLAQGQETETHDIRPSIERGPDLTLADIHNFDLRMKLAKLMAIAPALPVRDLYGLLVEMKGHYNDAKVQVYRATASQTPRLKNDSQRITAFQPMAEMHPGADDDGEVMVKIDLDNPDIYLDNDIPSLPSPPLISKKASAIKKNTKSGAHRERLNTNRSNTKGKSKPKADPNSSVHASSANTKSHRVVKRKAKPNRITGGTGGSEKRSTGTARSRKSKSVEHAFVLTDDDSGEGFYRDGSYRDGSYSDKGSIRDSDDEATDLDVVEEDLDSGLHIAMERPFYVLGRDLDIGP
jgi:hypothetical protein